MPVSRALRYVAMCDVLGFRRLVETTPLDEVVNRYDRLLSATREHTERHVHTFDRNRCYLSVEHIPHAVFSDTLLLWTDVNPEDNSAWIGVQNLLDVTGALIAVSGLIGLPLRVGVAYGDCFIDPKRNMYVGMAIVEAYRTEQRQNWFGGACHPSCHDAPFFRNLYHPSVAVVIPYDAPIHQKRDGPTLAYSINWPAWAPEDVARWLDENSGNSHDPDKYINAREFLEFAEQYGPFHF